MKIAISSPLASSSRPQYGTETVVRNLALALAEEKHRVDLLVHPAHGKPREIGWVKGSIQAVNLDGRHKRTLARAIARYANDHQPDTILSIARRDNLALCWARPHIASHIPIVISEHLAISDSLNDYNIVKRWFRLRMMRRSYVAADAVLGVSQGIASELRSFLGLEERAVQIMHNPVISDELARLAEEPIKHPWFQPNKPPVILAIGRLDAHKDFETLLKAFSQLLTSLPCNLLILGEGSERQRLHDLAQELDIATHVDMPGFTTNPFPYLRKANLLTLSSRMEGLPTVLIEALGLGTPVVSTDCPHGPREILIDGRYGALVPVGDYKCLAQAMLETLRKPLPSQELKQRANDFSANRSATQYIDLFERLVAARVTAA